MLPSQPADPPAAMIKPNEEPHCPREGVLLDFCILLGELNGFQNKKIFIFYN